MPTARLDPAIERLIVHTHDCKCGCRAVTFHSLEDDPKDEKEFQAAIIKEAKKLLWDCFHVTNSRRSKAGFPDIVLWRERMIYAELKTEKGITSAAQETVIAGLRAAGAEVYVWRPSDWSQIVEVLK